MLHLLKDTCFSLQLRFHILFYLTKKSVCTCYQSVCTCYFFMFFQHNFCVKLYVPREPRRDPSNRRLYEHGIWYISDTARNRTHNLFRPKCAPIPLGHSDGQRSQWQKVSKYAHILLTCTHVTKVCVHTHTVLKCAHILIFLEKNV